MFGDPTTSDSSQSARMRASLARALLVLFLCNLPMMILLAVAGWQGQGVGGKWAGPGLGGLIVGAIAGLCPFFLAMFVAACSSVGNRFVTISGGILLWLALLTSRWLAGGWTGVLTFLIRLLPAAALLGLIAWLFEIGRRRYWAVSTDR
ncbi:MAG: hypothetical protein ACP5XB_15100 [Isosphaeraceae bacterium]